MNRFLIKVTAFGTSIFLLFLISILATENKFLSDFLSYKIPLTIGASSHQWTRQGEADTTRNVDVLIVGSSLAQSIDVRNFTKYKLRAFNLASGSQSPIQTSYLFDKYLDSFNPKLVIWDVHAYTFANTGVESTIDLLSNCSDCGGMISMLFKTNSSLAWKSYLKRMMRKPFEEKNYVAPRETKLSKYITGGYMEMYFEAPDSPEKMTNFYYHGLDLQKKIFESELKSLKGKSISVILVNSPKSDEYILNFQNQQDWFEYYTYLMKQGLVEGFLNFNEVFSGNEEKNSFFYDIAHLTPEGIKNYNTALIDSISERLEVLKKVD